MLVATVCALAWVGPQVARADDPAPLRIVDVDLFWQAPATALIEGTSKDSVGDALTGVAVAATGEVFVTVNYEGILRLYKLDAEGHELWHRDLPGPDAEISPTEARLVAIADGGAVICNGYDFMSRVDSVGSVLWTIEMGNTGSSNECIRLLALANGWFAVASMAYDSDGKKPWNESFLLQVIDGEGSQRWQYEFGNAYYAEVEVGDLIEMTNGDLLAVIDTHSPNVVGQKRWPFYRWQLRFSPRGEIRELGPMERSVPSHRLLDRLHTTKLSDGTLLRSGDSPLAPSWFAEIWSGDAQARIASGTATLDITSEDYNLYSYTATVTVYDDEFRYGQVFMSPDREIWFLCFSRDGRLLTYQVNAFPQPRSSFDTWDSGIAPTGFFAAPSRFVYALDHWSMTLYRGRIAE